MTSPGSDKIRAVFALQGIYRLDGRSADLLTVINRPGLVGGGGDDTGRRYPRPAMTGVH